MTRGRVLAIAAAAGVVTLAVALLPRAGAEEEPVRDHLPVKPVVVRDNVLLDIGGMVLDRFTGDCAGSGQPYLCRYVIGTLREEDRVSLAHGGLTVRTTVDGRMQRAAQRALGSRLGRDDPQVATMVMISPGGGEIRAMAASRDFGEDRGLQQGTTAMAYTLAAALEAGMRYDDGFPAAGPYQAPGLDAFRNCAGDAVGDPMHSIIDMKRKPGDGFVTLRTGTRATVNTFFLRLEERVGLCETVGMARRLGLGRADGAPLSEYETFTLGTNEVHPVSVAATYATLAGRGVRCAPRAFTEVSHDDGAARLYPARCERAVEAAVADAVTDVLADGPDAPGLGRDAAGLPGTTDAYTAAWYAGYTPDLAAAVSLGDPRNPFEYPLRDVTIGGRHYPQVYGWSVPADIWRDAMREALRDEPESAFTDPDPARFGGCRAACPP